MEETRTGGKKEFFFSVIWAVLLMLLGRLIIALLPEYKLIGMIITILMFCALGFLVLTRYSAVYTYSLKNGRFRVNRRIGGRNKEIEISAKDIISVTRKRPRVSERALNMRVTVFSQKDIWYIVYTKNKSENMLVCTISEKMAAELKRLPAK